MDFFEAVMMRGSYRGEFKDACIPKEDIEKIISAGIHAPSGMNYQTTSFIAVINGELRTAIADIMPTPATRTAPLFIVAVSKLCKSNAGLSFEIEDYAAAVENILLAITALGYAGVWMDGMTKQNGNGVKLAALLNISDEFTVRTIIPVGKPIDRVIQKVKEPLNKRFFIDRM